MHTHATESYEDCDAAQYDTRNTWRSTDNNRNMVAVGNAIEEERVSYTHLDVYKRQRRSCARLALGWYTIPSSSITPPTTAPTTGRRRWSGTT